LLRANSFVQSQHSCAESQRNFAKSQQSFAESQHSEDNYAEDFEDYVSNEETKTEKQVEVYNFEQTTEFSLSKVNYVKIRNDLSDFSLLLLKNTATLEGVNKNGILVKKV